MSSTKREKRKTKKRVKKSKKKKIERGWDIFMDEVEKMMYYIEPLILTNNQSLYLVKYLCTCLFFT